MEAINKSDGFGKIKEIRQSLYILMPNIIKTHKEVLKWKQKK